LGKTAERREQARQGTEDREWFGGAEYHCFQVILPGFEHRQIRRPTGPKYSCEKQDFFKVNPAPT
jgi:hypothetical protein